MFTFIYSIFCHVKIRQHCYLLPYDNVCILHVNKKISYL